MNEITAFKKHEKKGAKITLFYGLLFSFLSIIPIIFIFLILFLSIDLVGMIGVGMLSIYFFLMLIPVLIAFPFALWYLGKRNVRSLLKDQSIVKISAEFSFGVNFIIWLSIFVFLLVFGDSIFLVQLFLIMLILLPTLSGITTFTIGLFIVKKTKNKMETLYDSPKN